MRGNQAACLGVHTVLSLTVPALKIDVCQTAGAKPASGMPGLTGVKASSAVEKFANRSCPSLEGSRIKDAHLNATKQLGRGRPAHHRELKVALEKAEQGPGQGRSQATGALCK